MRPRLVAKSLALRTKPNRAVTFELESVGGGLRAASVIILTPPEHGTVHVQEILHFPQESASQARYVSEVGTTAPRTHCLVFQPNPGFMGRDRFSYQLAEEHSRSEPTTVSILVTNGNSVPVATPQSLGVKLGQSLWINLGGTDEDNVPLEVCILTQPAFGCLRVPDEADYFGPFYNEEEANLHPFKIRPGVFIYEPTFPENLDDLPPDWSPGTDHFTFVVQDGTATSLPAKVTLEIKPFNLAPTGKVGVVEAVAAWSTAETAVVIANSQAGAEITLDASDSSEPNGAPLEIFWSLMVPSLNPRQRREELPFAQGMFANTELSIGRHPIVAHVSDGANEDMCTLNVKVISPDHAIKRLAADLRTLQFPDAAGKSLHRLLREITALTRTGQFRSAAAGLKTFRAQLGSIPVLVGNKSDLKLAATVESILNAIHPAAAVITPFARTPRTLTAVP